MTTITAQNPLGVLDAAISAYSQRSQVSFTEFFNVVLDVRNAVAGHADAIAVLDVIGAKFSKREVLSHDEFFDSMLDVRNAVG